MATRPLVATGLLTLALTACGAGAASDPKLSPLANEGRSVYVSKGCATCHGNDAEGRIGPELTGLHGREVEVVVSGETLTVVADERYLRESIVDPEAKRTAGARSRMPATPLDVGEVDALVQYIVELAPGD